MLSRSKRWAVGASLLAVPGLLAGCEPIPSDSIAVRLGTAGELLVASCIPIALDGYSVEIRSADKWERVVEVSGSGTLERAVAFTVWPIDPDWTVEVDDWEQPESGVELSVQLRSLGAEFVVPASGLPTDSWLWPHDLPNTDRCDVPL
jgi:hypothetical protein